MIKVEMWRPNGEVDRPADEVEWFQTESEAMECGWLHQDVQVLMTAVEMGS